MNRRRGLLLSLLTLLALVAGPTAGAQAASAPTGLTLQTGVGRSAPLGSALVRPDPLRTAITSRVAAHGYDPIVVATGVAAEEGAAERGGLNLYKWKDPTSTTASGWRDGDRMLTVPWKGSPKATWAENASRLRREMRSGKPIYETYVDSAGNQIPTKGFLNAERNLLSNHGWEYDPGTRAWIPPR